MSISIYIIVAVVVAMVASYPSTDYSASDVFRVSLFWPLYAIGWIARNLVKAIIESVSGK